MKPTFTDRDNMIYFVSIQTLIIVVDIILNRSYNNLILGNKKRASGVIGSRTGFRFQRVKS